jgi:hypothetical protein
MSSWANRNISRKRIGSAINNTVNITKNDINNTADNIISLIIILNNDTIHTLRSLLSQTDHNWLALIVITSNIPNNITDILYSDNRFKIIDCTFEKEKSDEYYKNYGATFVYTDWLLFINSGIILSSNCIELLRHIIQSNNIDCIFFKLSRANTIYDTFCYKTILFYDNYILDKNIFQKLHKIKYIIIHNILYK